MKDLSEHYAALVVLESIEAVIAAALEMMHRHGPHAADTNAAIYLAARTVIVNNLPRMMDEEKRFVDCVFEICPLALPNVRVIAHMLILQNDDEDNYGFVEELARYICLKGDVPFRFPMFRFKLHALRLQAETTRKQYEHMLSDRDMGPVMLFVNEMIERLEERKVLVVDDEERERTNEIIDEVYEELGSAHLSFDPLFRRIYYVPEGGSADESRDEHAESIVAATTSHVDWYDTIAINYARPAAARSHNRKRRRM